MRFEIHRHVWSVRRCESRSETFTCREAPALQGDSPAAGGASNRKLVIRLTDTNLRLRSITATPRRSRSAYLLAGGH